MILKLLAISVSIVAAAGLSPSFAQNPEGALPGRAHAASYAPLPADLSIAVRPWDNNAANQRLKSKFTEALSQRGVKLAEGSASLTLNFETEVESIAVPDSGPTWASCRHAIISRVCASTSGRRPRTAC